MSVLPVSVYYREVEDRWLATVMKSWRQYLAEVDAASKEIMDDPSKIVPTRSKNQAGDLALAKQIVQTAKEKNLQLTTAAKAVGAQRSSGMV